MSQLRNERRDIRLSMKEEGQLKEKEKGKVIEKGKRKEREV